MKTLVAVLMIFTLGALNAQKGSFYLGGNVGFNSTSEKVGNNDKKTTSNWALSPEIGTWLSDNLQAGIALNIGGASNDFASTNLVGATLYARNWWKPGQSFRPFVGLNLSYSTGKRTLKNSNYENKYNSLGANLNAGFGYSLSEKWAVIGSFGFLGFESGKSEDTAGVETTSSDFGFDVSTLGNRFNVGFYYTL
ncbi:MAG TPA: outer membrane beta-barrel protein [Saprospiraceae bacterium]|nr:outer membrane beta-barrel protein [Saprospiraceae bacterium]